LRAIFAICLVCFASAIYSGYRIVSETHLHTEPSPVPGVSRSLHRDSIASLEVEQRIRASRLAAMGTRPSSTLDRIILSLGGH
jgi:hypothetical protein